MTDLDAIRAQEAAITRLLVDASGTEWYAPIRQLDCDRRALLAEVDRLTNLHDDKSCPGCLAADAEVDRLTAENAALRDEWDGTEGASPAWWRGSDHGVSAERARIRAAVEALPHAEAVVNEWLVDRAAVLAAIDGAER
jgi:hypothetical protein